MVLTTHAVVGGLIGAVAAHNLPLAVAAGFLSHFILDTIPHWDYHLNSTHEDKENPLNNDIKTQGRSFVIDLVKIGFDFCLGIALVIWMFYGQSNTLMIGALLGALAAIAPDPLQFVYWKFRRQPLIALQKFHAEFMHAKMRLNHKPVLGVLCQVGMIAVTMILSARIF